MKKIDHIGIATNSAPSIDITFFNVSVISTLFNDIFIAIPLIIDIIIVISTTTVSIII